MDVLMPHPFGDLDGSCGGTGNFTDPWDSDCDEDSDVTETSGDGRLTQYIKTINSDEAVAFEYSFSKEVILSGYLLSDLDSRGQISTDTANTQYPGNSFQDEVMFSAFDINGDPVTTFIDPGQSDPFLIVGNSARAVYALDSINRSDPDGLSGMIGLTTADRIARFVVEYSNGPDDQTAEEDHPEHYAWWSNGMGEMTHGVSDDQRVTHSDFILCVTESLILPLELLSFEVIRQDDHALLEWTTVNEVNYDRFLIEKSYDGKKFTAIGSEPGKGASSGEETSYIFRDPLSAHHEKLYYRLRMVDLDGSYTFSSIKSVVLEKIRISGQDLSVHYFPNPFSENVRLDIELLSGNTAAESQEYSLTVYGMDGRRVYGRQVKNGDQIDLSEYTPGVYLFQLASLSGDLLLNTRMIKE